MLTTRIVDAFAFAEDLHRGQLRKGTAIPYISHPMAVSALVLEHGGDEDQAIAALLHDTVEDQGGLPVARDISATFGPRVAQLVLGCSDAVAAAGEPKPPWLERKTRYIAKLGHLPPETALIVACDKIHNLGTLIGDVEREGPSTLSRFARPGSLSWYYSAVAEALSPFSATAPIGRLRKLAARFSALIAGHDLPSGDRDA